MKKFIEISKLFLTYTFFNENVWWKGMMESQEIKGSFTLGPPILWCVFPSVSYMHGFEIKVKKTRKYWIKLAWVFGWLIKDFCDYASRESLLLTLSYF